MNLQSNSSTEWIRLGKIGKAYRLDGSFFVSERENPFPKSVKWLIIGDPKMHSQTKFMVKFSRKNGKRIVANLEEINTIEKIETYKGSDLWTTRDQIPLDKKEYLWADMVDKKVYSKDGDYIGIITKVDNFGASDIVDIKNIEKNQFLSLPFSQYYFDMAFEETGDKIHLIVDSDTFVDAWQDL